MYELWLTQCMACMEASRVWSTLAQAPWWWVMEATGDGAASSEPWLHPGRRMAPPIGNCAAAVYSRFGLNLETLRVANGDAATSRRVGC